MAFFEWLLAHNFMPHGHCYNWRSDILWMHVLSDATIALAYFSIPITLLFFLIHKKNSPFRNILILFAAFIILCGTTHIISIINIWYPVYVLGGGVKALAAVVSIMTAIALIPLVPKALSMRTPAELEVINKLLIEEGGKRKAAMQDLVIANKKRVVASRRAGMAEVAVDVLHNVGNVLNSANVSINMAINRTKKIRTERMKDVVALMQERAENLENYLANDPKGKLIPAFLLELSQEMQEVKQDILSELKNTRLSINRINKLVALQEGNTAHTAEPEVIQIAELVEDCLSMFSDIEGSRIHLICAITDTEVIKSDRYRLLKILNILINNAISACYPVAVNERKIIVTVQKRNEVVQISVSDNCPGYTAKQLQHVFKQAVNESTESLGNSLHDAAMAALEIDAILTARCNPSGAGSTFTLQLPKQEPE